MQTETSHTQKLIRTNGITLNIVQAGPVDGELIILLHGFPEFWYGWRGQIDYLANEGYRVWAPDQRGYNLSDKPTDTASYKISELVADVIGLIHADGREQAHIIGHDWGAMVAWWTALLHPEAINKLGILNVPHPHVFEQTLRSDVRQLFKSWYAGMFQIPWLPERIVGAGNWRIMAEAMQKSGKRGSFTDADMEKYREAWSKPAAMTSMMNWYRAYVQHRPEPPADWRVRVPTLMIWGEKDRFLSARMAQPSIDLCDEGTLHTFDDATHWVQHDKADEVNALLSEFLA